MNRLLLASVVFYSICFSDYEIFEAELFVEEISNEAILSSDIESKTVPLILIKTDQSRFYGNSNSDVKKIFNEVGSKDKDHGVFVGDANNYIFHKSGSKEYYLIQLEKNNSKYLLSALIKISEGLFIQGSPGMAVLNRKDLPFFIEITKSGIESSRE